MTKMLEIASAWYDASPDPLPSITAHYRDDARVAMCGEVVAVVRFPVESWWGDGPDLLDVQGPEADVDWFRECASAIGIAELVLGDRLGIDPTDPRGCRGFEFAGCAVLFRGRMVAAYLGDGEWDNYFDVESAAVVSPSGACPGCGWLHGLMDCPEIGGG